MISDGDRLIAVFVQGTSEHFALVSFFRPILTKRGCKGESGTVKFLSELGLAEFRIRWDDEANEPIFPSIIYVYTLLSKQT